MTQPVHRARSDPAPGPSPLAVLLVEDSETDAILLVDALKEGGYSVYWDRVETAEQLKAALARSAWDLVLADYSLPRFGGMEAIEIVKRSALDIPLILVSGQIDDEVAIDALHAGAVDFIVKNRLARLIPAVRRELADAADRAERRQAEATLRFSEQKYRRLFDSLTDGALLCDDRLTRVLDVNLSAERLLGWDRTSLLGATASLFSSAGNPPGLEQCVGSALQQSTPMRVETTCTARHGSVVPMLITAIPVLLSNRRLVLLLLHDLTEQKRADERIRRLRAELEGRVEQRTRELKASMAELEAFSYSVSHDLRAPLRAADGLVRMLLAPAVVGNPTEHERVAGLLRGEIRKMGQLIDDMLAFSRVGRQPLGYAEVDMSELARGSFHELVDAGTAAGVTLKLDDLPHAFGDRSMLRRVFDNLLGNAVKFSRNRPDPTITITGRRLESAVEYCVADNGVGFDPAYVDRLFTVFQRLHSESEFEGTGVGLAIVKRIIDRHGGRVRAEGRPNQGASFTFVLPAADPAKLNADPCPDHA